MAGTTKSRKQRCWRLFRRALAAAVVFAPSVVLGQMAGELPKPSDQRKLERPSEVTLMKESSLIEEVLDPELIFRIAPSRSKVVRTRVPIQRVAITDPSMVEINEFGPTEFEIIGLKAGETTLTMWFDDGNGNVRRLRYLVKVAANDSELEQAAVEYGKLQHRINELFPNSQIQLIPIADKLVIRGQARDSKEAAEILAIVGSQMSGQNNSMNGLVSSGGVASLPGAPNLAQTRLINLMKVTGEQQVILKVRIAELTRTAARDLGLNIAAQDGKVSIASVMGGGGNITAILDGGDVALLIKAISGNGYGKILAEPTLVALNGQPAVFMSGGEFAVPTAVGVQGVSAVATTFRGFGTMLAFTPTIIDKDKIRLHVAPSFSTQSGEAVNGIPSLKTRAVMTTVDMREGQWLALAGLIQDEQGGSRSRIPFIGDVPVAGALFSTQTKKRAETELLVLVSPEMVHPLEKDQVPPLLPGMDVTDPTDGAFFLFQQIEGVPGVDHRSTLWPQARQQVNLENWANKHSQRKCSRSFTEEQSYYVNGASGLSE